MKLFSHFLLPFTIALLLAILCAWFFGSALANTYPDGVLVFPPEGNAPPEPSDAFHMGMAIGWFFCAAFLATLSLSIFSLNRFKTTRLKPLPAPLISASLVCVILIFVSISLAG